MRAAICTAYGPPDVLVVRDVPRPEPGRGEIRVRIWASTVNSSDWFIRSGLPDASLFLRMAMKLALGIRRPRRQILGLILAGEVEALGPGTSRFALGDRVWAYTKFRLGGYAQYTCLAESSTVAVAPANLDHGEAAALVYGGLLGLHCVRRGEVAAGQRVLVYGASGAVGTMVVQLARHLGAEVTAVCGPTNASLVQSLGAAEVLDYTAVDAPPPGAPYDLMLDAVGKRKTSALRTACEAAATRAISVDDGTPELPAEDLVHLRALAESGAIRPVIDRTWPLEEIVAAHAYVQNEHKAGNVVITIP